MRTTPASLGSAVAGLGLVMASLLAACSSEYGSEEPGTLVHFRNSIQLRNQASVLFAPPADPGPTYTVDRTTQQRALRLYREALEEARKVSGRDLRRLHGGLPVAYEDHFRKGLELYIQGLEQHDPDLLRQARAQLTYFGDWYHRNLKSN